MGIVVTLMVKGLDEDGDNGDDNDDDNNDDDDLAMTTI